MKKKYDCQNCIHNKKHTVANPNKCSQCTVDSNDLEGKPSHYQEKRVTSREQIGKAFVGTVTEYAIAAVTTGKVVPTVFMTEEEAERFKQWRPDPSHWKLVSREVVYSEWE